MSLSLDPYIPGRYLLQALASGLLREDSEQQIEEFLKSEGLSLQALEHTDSRFPIKWISHLIPKNSAISPLLLAVEFGNLAKLTSQGDLSLVLMTSANVREALNAACYLRLHSNAVTVDFRETQAAGYLIFDIKTGGKFTDEVLLYYSLAALRRLLYIITKQHPACTIKVAAEKPPEFEEFTLNNESEWKFNQPINCLKLDKVFLDTPSIFADPVEHSLAKRACESALSKMESTLSISDRVHMLMIDEGVWEQDLIADRLHISRSTLKRRLSQQGLSFAEQLNNARKKQAIHLLTASDFSLQTIAEQLGYSDQSNFSHAFKKWFNVAPGEFKNSHQ
ncbi:MAG: AraC family transcriptional regulator [Pseudomonadales bacterium]|nr:AraC family transcriptional regulator [Pseudomonadales bacterium]